ncbi:MAG: hypothetical protein E7439_00470 [Ruminococcaceae bacterium]|nr:hypothetical protein [Oscillospiraceae bacterium]
MANIMESVTMVLRAAGYRTGEASPGGIMPEITEPVVAVSLEHVDTSKQLVRICATVVSPLALGSRLCEMKALDIGRVLKNTGADCKIEPCKLNPKTEVFWMPVMATYQGNALSEDWSVGNICRIRFGSGYNLHTINLFTTWQDERDKPKEDEGSGEWPWRFRIEERIDEIKEENIPVNAFYMTIYFEGGTEYLRGCTLTGRKRTIQDGGLVQIWEGIAERRDLG